VLNFYSGRTNFPQGIELLDCQRLINNSFVKSLIKIVKEKELSIFINGTLLATASITPTMEREFVVGYLFGQGFITSAADIESIAIEDCAARVTVRNIEKILLKTRTTTYRIVSGGGRAIFSDEIASRISAGLTLDKGRIYAAMNTVLEKAEIYRETGGVHAAGLFTPEAGLICFAEDIGRHNTLDKVIGYTVINNIDRSNTFLASTGRMSSEMVVKICRANIPIVATKTAITELGREIGEKYGLTIVGFVKDAGTKMNTDMETRIVKERGMTIYTNPHRILGQ
jgi:FdhD protein